MSLVCAPNHKRNSGYRRDLYIEDTQRRKRHKVEGERLYGLDDEEYNPALSSKSNKVWRSSNPANTVTPNAFFDNSLYTSGADRSIESYQQYLESVANDVESNVNVDQTKFEDENTRHLFPSLQQWSSGIPDNERIVELSDEEGEDVEHRNSATQAKDPRAPTLAKILNFDDGTEPINREKASSTS